MQHRNGVAMHRESDTPGYEQETPQHNGTQYNPIFTIA